MGKWKSGNRLTSTRRRFSGLMRPKVESSCISVSVCSELLLLPFTFLPFLNDEFNWIILHPFPNLCFKTFWWIYTEDSFIFMTDIFTVLGRLFHLANWLYFGHVSVFPLAWQTKRGCLCLLYFNLSKEFEVGLLLSVGFGFALSLWIVFVYLCHPWLTQGPC